MFSALREWMGQHGQLATVKVSFIGKSKTIGHKCSHYWFLLSGLEEFMGFSNILGDIGTFLFIFFCRAVSLVEWWFTPRLA